jgi:hypothetical protein
MDAVGLLGGSENQWKEDAQWPQRVSSTSTNIMLWTGLGKGLSSFWSHIRKGSIGMLSEKKFRKVLRGRGLGKEGIDVAVNAVKEFEEFLKETEASFESADLNRLKEYLSMLIAEGKNSMDRLLAIAHYCNLTKKNDYYVYLAQLLNGRDVLPLIRDRLADVAGEETRRRVFDGFVLPPLGAPPDDYPKLTKLVVDRMKAELPASTCRKVLTGNYHQISAEAFREKKERFDKAASIDKYLKGEHERLVKELTAFMKEGRIWYEQEITPEVVEFVRKSPEIQNGVRRGNKIYVTKIPYAPKEYLREKDPILRRYYACHCPLARTAIRDGKITIPSVFCYCSGGFEKAAFDVIFGKPTKVRLLESALEGDPRCRFAISIPKSRMK